MTDAAIRTTNLTRDFAAVGARSYLIPVWWHIPRQESARALRKNESMSNFPFSRDRVSLDEWWKGFLLVSALLSGVFLLCGLGDLNRDLFGERLGNTLLGAELILLLAVGLGVYWLVKGRITIGVYWMLIVLTTGSGFFGWFFDKGEYAFQSNRLLNIEIGADRFRAGVDDVDPTPKERRQIAEYYAHEFAARKLEMAASEIRTDGGNDRYSGIACDAWILACVCGANVLFMAITRILAGRRVKRGNNI